MKVHVLPGDSLVKAFEESGIDGEVVVCRECFVDGPLEADGLESLWDFAERNTLSRFSRESGVDYTKDVVGRVYQTLEFGGRKRGKSMV